MANGALNHCSKVAQDLKIAGKRKFKRAHNSGSLFCKKRDVLCNSGIVFCNKLRLHVILVLCSAKKTLSNPTSSIRRCKLTVPELINVSVDR